MIEVLNSAGNNTPALLSLSFALLLPARMHQTCERKPRVEMAALWVGGEVLSWHRRQAPQPLEAPSIGAPKPEAAAGRSSWRGRRPLSLRVAGAGRGLAGDGRGRPMKAASGQH